MAAPEKNFVEQFSTAFELFSYNNALFGRLCAHTLLGQILRNVRIHFGPIFIDPRISLFFIQPSGTGKSTPWTFIKEVGTHVGLKMDDIDEATDAALVGTEEAEEVIDPESKTKTIVHNEIKGKLAEADILHYDEGQMLVRRGQYAQNTLAWFQKALNPIGSGQNLITKNLAHKEISFHPSCSLLITSHEIENLMETVLNTGFFQRIVLYPRYVSIDERKLNEFLRASRFGKKIFSELDVETLGDKLMAVAKKNEKFEVTVHPNVYPLANQGIENRYKLVETAHERVREIMATFIPRYDNLMYIFSVHHCCVEGKTVVDIEDIKYGMDLSQMLFKDVMSWVEENITLSRLTSKENSYLTSAFQIYKVMEKDENGYVHFASFLKNCNQRWHITIPTILRFLEKFKGLNKMKEITENNSKKIKIEI
jgi:hypothetical protein